jgi:hypothetical protein
VNSVEEEGSITAAKGCRELPANDSSESETSPGAVVVASEGERDAELGDEEDDSEESTIRKLDGSCLSRPG